MLAKLRERVDRSYPGEVVAEFLRIDVIERSLALASKLFVAVIPLSIILNSVVPGNASVGESLVRRFGLMGAGAAATDTLFASKNQVQGNVGVIGLLILLYSVFSFTRGLQRVYLDVWQLAPQRFEAIVRRATWIVGFAVYTALLGPVRSLEVRNSLTIAYLVTLAALGTALWVFTPWILLGRRIPWRRLLPTGILTSVCVTVYTAASTQTLPAIMTHNALRYGQIGIAFGLVSWLFVYAAIVVTAVIAAGVWDRRRHGIASPAAAPRD